jgi:2-amino-4-hydroxy-6-hydroxymethyldihydropteridine diphosphokinase
MVGNVYLGLGANLGRRAEQIRAGLAHLEESGAVRVLRVSSFYETEPVGWPDGPWYLNAVARVETSLSPHDLLALLKDVECRLGRRPAQRNAPRPLDLDLLLYDDQHVDEPAIHVPHPRMLERAFVLLPLSEIAPDAEVAPGLSAAVAARGLNVGEAIRRAGPLPE